MKRRARRHVGATRRIQLNWRKPVFYLVLPLLIFLAFVGFPPPFAPLRPTKPAQEQAAPAEEARDSMPG